MRNLSWGEYKKTILDKLIQNIRFSLVTNQIQTGKILDLGCGYNAELLHYLEPRIITGIGIDVSVNKRAFSKKIQLIRGRVDRKIKLPSNTFNAVTALALLEHIDRPDILLKESYRLLKNGGVLLLTTPHLRSKGLLEFLAYRLHLISGHEISDHKRYYTSESLRLSLVDAGFKQSNTIIKSIFGLTIYARATK